MRHVIQNSYGFTLIEIVLVVIILGIIATIATMNFSTTVDTMKQEATLTEMDAIAKAIAGNPQIVSDGARTDFGYVGDVGALPANLDVLVNNPGYATWHGPYLESGFSTDDFKRDGWNAYYTITDTVIRSTGSGVSIDKVFAPSKAALLSNIVAGYISDANGNYPTATFSDSIVIQMTCPDGLGSMITTTTSPDIRGYFTFSNTPIGNHTVKVIYIPDHDTASYSIAVYPGHNTDLQITFPADLW